MSTNSHETETHALKQRERLLMICMAALLILSIGATAMGLMFAEKVKSPPVEQIKTMETDLMQLRVTVEVLKDDVEKLKESRKQ